MEEQQVALNDLEALESLGEDALAKSFGMLEERLDEVGGVGAESRSLGREHGREERGGVAEELDGVDGGVEVPAVRVHAVEVAEREKVVS